MLNLLQTLKELKFYKWMVKYYVSQVNFSIILWVDVSGPFQVRVKIFFNWDIDPWVKSAITTKSNSSSYSHFEFPLQWPDVACSSLKFFHTFVFSFSMAKPSSKLFPKWDFSSFIYSTLSLLYITLDEYMKNMLTLIFWHSILLARDLSLSQVPTLNSCI